MKIRIENIKISARIRQENPEVSRLKESIQEIGLINPIVVNEDNELLSGFRRLKACRELSWEEIEAIVFSTGTDEIKKLDIEYHENLGRMDLTSDDRINYEQMREQLLNPPKKRGIWGMLQRLWELISNLFKRNKGQSSRNNS